MLTAAISDARDWIAQAKVLLHSASPLIPNLSDKKTQWRKRRNGAQAVIGTNALYDHDYAARHEQALTWLTIR